MAEISKLSRLLNGMQRQVDLAANTLAVSEVKVGGTGASGTVLSKADLDTLIGGSGDASSLHNHDGRYYTQTQLGSTTDGSSGASLIGVDQTPAFTNISGATVQAMLESVDTALSTAGAVEFADNEFRVFDDGDNTKKMAFELSGITASTTRTLTLQDKDITVAGIADETFTGTTTVDRLVVGGQVNIPIQSQTASTDSAIDWNESNVQQITLDQNATLTFSNGADGGQYLLIVDQNGTGGFDITWPADVEFIGPAPVIQQGANDRTIVSFFYDPAKTGAEYQGLSSNDIVSMANGGTGANLTATAGAIVYSDADSMELSSVGTSGQILTSGGAGAPTWTTLAGGDGVAYDGSGSFSVDLDTNPGLEFNAGKLRALVDPAGAVLRGASGLSVAVDDSTIEIATNALQVKADGIKSTHVAFDNNTALRIRNAADSAYIDAIKVNASDEIVFGSLPKDATVPTDDAHLVNKLYVDTQVSAASAGLDPKESVRVATTADVGGSYSAGTISGLGASLSIDGVSLAANDRVLVKDQSNALQNGIYTYDGVDELVRAEDQDGTPAAEVSGGNFTFVEQGTAGAGSGWVVVGDGILTLDTDNIVWTQFSASGAFTGGNGIDIDGSNVISVDLATTSGLEFSAGKLQLDLLLSGGLKLSGNELAVEPADFAGEGLQDDGSDNLALHFSGLTGEAAIAAADVFGFYDDSATAHRKITWGEMLTKAAGAGLALNTDVLDVQVGDGIEIASDAVALDIDGIAASATTLEAADLLAIHDDSAAGNATISIANALGDGMDLSAGKIAVQLGNGVEFDGAAKAKVKLAFDALAAETTMAASDVFAFQDADAASADADHKKITLANLLTQIAGDGLGIDVDKLVVNGGEGIDATTGDQVSLDFNSLTAETAIDDSDELAFFDVSAGSHKKITRANLLGDLSQVSEIMVAGESFEANTVHAVRIAVSGETAGRVYKADNDASAADNFYVIGLAVNNTASAIAAGGDISVVKLGSLTLETSDLTAAATDIGKPVYLDATGDFTLTAPSAADTAIVKVGILRTHDAGGAHTLECQIQAIGVN